jgi:hypothetical protein
MHGMWNILKKQILGFFRVLLLVTSRKIMDARQGKLPYGGRCLR